MNSPIDYEKLKLFYIGKEKNPDGSFNPLVYKNKDLTTHAAIIGMTGSGKTGLGISLLEEAAIDNIPSIIIDPKGDMGNLLLTFPNLLGSDFEPWVEEQDAINNGLSLSEHAQKTADLWRKGLSEDFQSPERIAKLKNAADFTIYTPGSSAGIQISILQTFSAPPKEILEDNDLLVSLVNSTVSSLLSLIDEKNDASSKEAILLSSLFMNAYTQAQNLTLEELITRIVTPPFKKIGIFDVETFFTQDERLKLALKLNAIIANPSFKTWIEGEPLDISKLLYDEAGKAKVSIFSIAHLNDTQRMFFVSLLLNHLLTWMRRQEGTSSLKALLYMDEIFGYFPPSSNPPSKQPMLTLLKQARSFGIGIILSTQNPVDIDYKGLSNIGTWFIGRLQTKQDKEKVIDGLSSASEGAIDKNALMNLLSNLDKRVFILKNINEDGLKVFTTRWALSYLKGPISKEDIRKLMQAKQTQAPVAQVSKQEAIEPLKASTNQKVLPKPMMSNTLEQRYSYSSQSSSYDLQPNLFMSCSVHFNDASKNIDQTTECIYKIALKETMQSLDIESAQKEENIPFETKERTNSSFFPLPTFIQNERELKLLQKEFTDFIYRTNKLTLYKNDTFKLFSKQNETLSDFKIRLQDRLNEAIDEAVDKLQQKYQKSSDALEKKLDMLSDRLEREQAQANAATTDTLISIGSSILGAFFGKSLVTRTTIGKIATGARGANRVLRERSDIKRVEEEIQEVQADMDDLKNSLEKEIEAINETNQLSRLSIEEFYITPKRSDIFNIKQALVWEEI
ncbi:MAG: DUF853 family protein [Sulfurospirillaceae bacterium]|nr:DUF853 family protein [Sulfurospirillaceae bacterium]MDD2826666.1 DUF853 family protein [Sulfurospirillaceae bacterium]